jgi:hypothetical protein
MSLLVMEVQGLGRRKAKKKQRMEGRAMLYADYFANNPSCTCKKFWFFFRINKELFMKLLHGVREYDTYFMMNKGVIGVFGFL